MGGHEGLVTIRCLWLSSFLLLSCWILSCDVVCLGSSPFPLLICSELCCATHFIILKNIMLVLLNTMLCTHHLNVSLVLSCCMERFHRCRPPLIISH